MLKKFLLITAINFFLILLILYGFELFLRIKDPYREIQNRFSCGNKRIKITKEGWGILNGKVVSSWGHSVRFNSFGIKGFPSFRERDFETPKPKDTFRIMVLGDSFTWGVGISEDERYTNVLEKMLNERFPRQKFEVLNFSVLGFCTVEEANLLIAMKDIVNPDLIIIGFCINDPKPGPQGASPERDNFERKLEEKLGPPLKLMCKIGLSRLSDLIKNSIWKFAEIVNIIPTWQEVVDRAYNPESKEWNEFLKALREIKKVSDDMGLPPPIFAVLNHGTSNTKPTNYNHPDKELKLYLKWWHQAERAAKKRGFITCNIEDEIKRELSKVPLGVNKWDAHPSEKIHKIYAKKIFSVVCDIIENSKLEGVLK